MIMLATKALTPSHNPAWPQPWTLDSVSLNPMSLICVLLPNQIQKVALWIHLSYFSEQIFSAQFFFGREDVSFRTYVSQRRQCHAGSLLACLHPPKLLHLDINQFLPMQVIAHNCQLPSKSKKISLAFTERSTCFVKMIEDEKCRLNESQYDNMFTRGSRSWRRQTVKI